MKRILSGEKLFVALLIFLSILTGCASSSSDDTETGSSAGPEQPADKELLKQIEEGLSGLVFNDSTNENLIDSIIIKLGLLDLEDEELIKKLETELKRLIDEEYQKGSLASANMVLKKFELLLDEVLLIDPGDDAEPVPVEGIDPQTVRVLASDGLTRKGSSGKEQEIIPCAVVYSVSLAESNEALSFLLAKKVEGALVKFSYRNPELGSFARWHPLGAAVRTDEKGKASPDKISDYLNDSCFPSFILRQQKDIEMKAEVLLPERTVTDESAFIRVLSTYESFNRHAILTDHDNTLHETGGSNTINDIIDASNVLKNEWPLIDAYVSEEVRKWISGGNDLIIVSGLPNQLRGKARSQISLHFGDSPRQIPMLLLNDTPFGDIKAFKKGVIGILKSLYGYDNIVAMVGDTAGQDGYGAYQNSVLYAPYKINYKANPDRLIIDGDVKVDPNDIAMNWSEVMEYINTGKLTKKNFWVRNNEFLNIAHRGGGILVPEDTLEAYRNAVAVGADAIEGDCHMTKDGVMVISHDDTVDRCTNGNGPIESLTLAEIKALDAGYWYTRDGVSYPFRGKGIRIPTVEEVFLMLTTDLNEVPMILEIKTQNDRARAVSLVLDLIEEYDVDGDLINRLQMGAFNQEALDYIYSMGKERGMDLIRCYSTEGVLEFLTKPVEEMLSPGYKSPGDVLALPWALATTSVIRKAREAGVNANVWTVNDEFHMKWLKDVIKVDGIMTDDPALLENIINQ